MASQSIHTTSQKIRYILPDTFVVSEKKWNVTCLPVKFQSSNREWSFLSPCVGISQQCTVGGKGQNLWVLQRSGCIIQKYAWRRKSDGKVSRRHIKENVEEEAWENKDGSGRGKAEGWKIEKGVVQRRFERAHHFYWEEGERRGGERGEGGVGRGEGGGGGGREGDASLIRRRRGNEKWGTDGARRGRKWRIKEFEGVAEGSLSTGVFNGNTRRNISVDAKSRGCVLCMKSFIKETMRNNMSWQNDSSDCAMNNSRCVKDFFLKSRE